jgi:hypothetical protein
LASQAIKTTILQKSVSPERARQQREKLVLSCSISLPGIKLLHRIIIPAPHPCNPAVSNPDESETGASSPPDATRTADIAEPIESLFFQEP